MIIYIRIRDISDFNMIDIITTSLFVFSSLYGGPTSTEPMVLATTTDRESTSKKEELVTTSIPTREELEQKAKEYFKDYPLLVDIARCESTFSHLDEDGEIVRGKVNKNDLGLMQINEYYHAEKAEELGFDLKTLEGNMAYAKYLYEKEGSKPWNSSSKCWKKSANYSLESGNHISLNK